MRSYVCVHLTIRKGWNVPHWVEIQYEGASLFSQYIHITFNFCTIGDFNPLCMPHLLPLYVAPISSCQT